MAEVALDAEATAGAEAEDDTEEVDKVEDEVDDGKVLDAGVACVGVVWPHDSGKRIARVNLYIRSTQA
jgi:hypothetical protein